MRGKSLCEFLTNWNCRINKHNEEFAPWKKKSLRSRKILPVQRTVPFHFPPGAASNFITKHENSKSRWFSNFLIFSVKTNLEEYLQFFRNVFSGQARSIWLPTGQTGFSYKRTAPIILRKSGGRSSWQLGWSIVGWSISLFTFGNVIRPCCIW